MFGPYIVAISYILTKPVNCYLYEEYSTRFMYTMQP